MRCGITLLCSLVGLIPAEPGLGAQLRVLLYEFHGRHRSPLPQESALLLAKVALFTPICSALHNSEDNIEPSHKIKG